VSDPEAASVQERFAPRSICFGCGPANSAGLHVRSIEVGDELVATWNASPHHQAFPGVLNGGICGAVLDCHANWAAAMALMRARGADRPPPTVTADYSVRLVRPSPIDRPLILRSRATSVVGDRATAEATIEADGLTTASFQGTFVAVGAGHPAYHRWD
jgi:acyl-coenzyme A thioesterase PaaI-like protein